MKNFTVVAAAALVFSMALSIEPGKSAGFIVIDQNLLEVPSQEIHKTKVLKTVLRGHTVHQSK